MILVIDNYDSFTFNVVQALESATKEEIKVVRNDEATLEQLAAMNPSHLIVSPGPGNPSGAGVSVEAIRYFAGKIPILGICLGHQAIGEAFGAKIVGAKFIKHGIVEEIDLDGRGVFRTIGKSAKFTRYHSLVIDEATKDLEVTARAKDGDIMGIRHKTMPIEGVQFHPESIASQACEELFKAFLNYRRDNLPVAEYLRQLLDEKKPLTRDQASFFMENLTDGTMDEKATAAILTAMAARGLPTADEMAGCAGALLKKKTAFPAAGKGLAEIVGTGGDGKGSFNISSLSALVATSCGQGVAKHGNRAVSSKSGAADFFENLGIKIMAEPEKTASLVEQTGFGFLMAPVYHAAMRFAAPVRKALGIKTIFNVLGPLLNPAGAEYEVLGVYSADLMEDYARAAKALGAKRVMVIHSRDGFDEISPCQPTDVFQINEDGKEYRYVIDPAKFGISGVKAEELEGGNGADNARLAMEVLNGGGRATIKAAVGLNAGALLYLSGKAKTLKDGYDMAVAAMTNGTTLRKLTEIQNVSAALNKEAVA